MKKNKEPTPLESFVEKTKRSPRELELEDKLSDILIGFNLWKHKKVGSLEWTDEDEQLARWIEHNSPDA